MLSSNKFAASAAVLEVKLLHSSFKLFKFKCLFLRLLAFAAVLRVNFRYRQLIALCRLPQYYENLNCLLSSKNFSISSTFTLCIYTNFAAVTLSWAEAVNAFNAPPSLTNCVNETHHLHPALFRHYLVLDQYLKCRQIRLSLSFYNRDILSCGFNIFLIS